MDPDRLAKTILKTVPEERRPVGTRWTDLTNAFIRCTGINIQDAQTMAPNRFNWDRFFSRLISRLSRAFQQSDYSTMPDIPLRIILSRIPLHELICTVPLVHSRWFTLQPSALVVKRQLVLYIGWAANRLIRKPAIPYADQILGLDGQPLFLDDDFNNEFTRLKLTTLTEEIVDKLTSMMPNISALQLTIYQISPDELTHAIRLLEHWSNSLKTLKLHCNLCPNNELILKYDQELLQAAALAERPLIVSLNRLSNLKHLQLHCFNLNSTDDPFDLPVLAQLKYFQLYTNPDAQVLFYKSLKKYAEPNEQLQFSIENVSRAELLAHFGETNLRHRYVKFSLLTGDAQDRSNQREARFLRTFTKLQTYEIDRFCMSEEILAQIQELLAPQENLHHLSIIIDTRYVFPNPAIPISSLPSVKVLSLSVYTFNHTELNYQHWGQLFPAVQIIKIAHTVNDYASDASDTSDSSDTPNRQKLSTCRHCYAYGNSPNPRNPRYKDYIIKGDCVKKLLKPFKQCVKLRKIYYETANYNIDDVFEFAIEDL